MKTLALLLIIPQIIFGQKVLVSTPVNTQLYLQVPNALDVGVEGFTCHEIIVEADNGKVHGEGCAWVIKPDRTGTLEIRIFNKKNHELLGEHSLNVVDIKPIACLKAPEDKNGRLLIERAYAISAKLEKINLEIDDRDLTFKVLIIRNDMIIYARSFSGRLFNDELKAHLGETLKGDLIVISEINLTVDAKSYSLNDIVSRRE